MTKLAIQSWEKNGYDDSDGYMIYLDTEDMEIKEDLWWSTRFAGGKSCDYNMRTDCWTPELINFAKEWLVQKIEHKLRWSEDYHIKFPKDVNRDEEVVLIKKHSNQIKTPTEKKCYSCLGSGEWINPRDKKDIRKCFACNGTGKKTTYKYIKGSGSRELLPGKKFTVSSSRDFGRYNVVAITVKGFDENGEFVQAPLDKLNMSIMQMSDAELREQAEYHAESMSFVSVFDGTWVDSNGDYINRAIRKMGE